MKSYLIGEFMGKIRRMIIIPALLAVFYTQTVFAQVSGMPEDCTYILMDEKQDR